MGGWFAVGVLVAACLALAPRYIQRRQRRRRVAICRARVGASLSALNQPDGAPFGEVVAPPTFDFAPNEPSAVRCRRTLMFGALYPDISVGSRALNDTLTSGWRFR